MSVMSDSNYKQLRPRPCLKTVKANLNSPGGPLDCRGQFIAKATVKGTVYHFRVIVVVNDVENLLSRGVASRMNLMTKLDAITDGIGCLKTEPVKIVLKEDAQPSAVTVARRVPIPMLPKVKDELERLKAAGVIEEITKPTPWCAPMVPVLKKSGAVRICVDLKRLNLSVERERYILPTLQDLTSRLAGATVFSSLDAASGFYQIPLHEDSQELTTFIMPMGRYCYRRLPFGITSAPEIFMRKMNELLQGLDGTFTYMDDILIYGKDKAEHDERFNKVLKVLASAGLKLNRDKSVIGQSHFKFLGHVFDANGIRSCPDKVRAILEMPAPSSVPQLRQILGMIHYLGSFLPDLHVVTRPLNDLLKADAVWFWGPDQELPCHGRLLLSVDRGVARKEYNNSSVRGQDEGRLRPFRFSGRNCVDNGPQFASSEFRSFVESNRITHITSFLPNANGEAERAVQTAKRILQRDPWLALMIYRDTVISATGHSPTQLLIGRHVKTNLPPPSSALRSCQSSPEDVRVRHCDRRHGARSLPSLSPGDEVRVKTPQQSDWSQKGVVSTPADTPRSFVVQTPSVGVYRRNRRHLQATSESTIPPIDVEPSVEPGVTTLSPTELPSSLSPVPRRSDRRAIKPDRLIEMC